MEKPNPFLLTGSILCFAISILHICIIFGGGDWYRFFGAGEDMAIMDENGSTHPAIVTGFISVILAIWGLYGLSGAGVVKKLFLQKLALVLISLILLTRGIFGIPMVILIDDPYMNELAARMTFMIITSLICLITGGCFAIGTYQTHYAKNHTSGQT